MADPANACGQPAVDSPAPVAKPESAARVIAHASSLADSPARTIPAEPSALQWPAAHARFWIVAIAGLSLDLWSKHWAFETLRQDREITIIPGVLTFKTMFNPGALFGIGAGQTSLFLLASVLALGLVLWMFAQSGPRRWLLHIALGGILAGALGNMYDRAFVKLVPNFWAQRNTPVRYYTVIENDGARAVLEEYPPGGGGPTPVLTGDVALERIKDPAGHVRDFIKIDSRVFNREVWPWVFNVADMLLVGGVSILALHLLRDGRQPRAPRGTAAAAAGSAAPLSAADGPASAAGPRDSG